MVKRINEAFADEEHNQVTKSKEALAKKLGKKKLNWHDYILYMSGKVIETKQFNKDNEPETFTINKK